MTAPAIEARGLGKTFRYRALRATSLKELALAGFAGRGEMRTHQALQGINFTLMPGEGLALMGANGSGKSTLLKLIAGISEPDQGALKINGQVAALLELGAGFQPELTGMENIFLQGSLLGLKRAEVLRRLDAIIGFSEVERFIHTPLFRYSSGMKIRLGFAIAVLSDAPILLVDEVLSVGDVAFREKCFRHIRRLKEEGRCFVVVSHVLEQLEHVADQVLWLHEGREYDAGPIGDVLPRYLEAMTGAPIPMEPEAEETMIENAPKKQSIRMATALVQGRFDSRDARIDDVRFLDASGAPCRTFPAGAAMSVEIDVTALRPLEGVEVEIGYGRTGDIRAGWHSSDLQGLHLRNVEGSHTVRAAIDPLPFAPGRYFITIALSDPAHEWHYFDTHLNSYSIHIRGNQPPENPALLLPPGEWIAPRG